MCQCVRSCMFYAFLYIAAALTPLFLLLFLLPASPPALDADAEVLLGRPLQTTRATQSAKLQIWPAYEYENECEYEYLVGSVCVSVSASASASEGSRLSCALNVKYK